MTSLRAIVSTVLTLSLAAGPAVAQTTGTTPSTTNTNTYENLSTGNRKIARALFEAQKTETPTTGTGTSGTGTSTSKSLTLDQIAAMKQSGKGWGQVFKDLQARGLVTEKKLGQVISRYNHTHQSTRTGEMTTAGNRTTDSGDVRAADGTHRGHGKSGHGDGTKVHGGSGHGSANSGHGSTSSGRGSGGNGSHGGGHGRSK